jgi:hypothetical protein
LDNNAANRKTIGVARFQAEERILAAPTGAFVSLEKNISTALPDPLL